MSRFTTLCLISTLLTLSLALNLEGESLSGVRELHARSHGEEAAAMAPSEGVLLVGEIEMWWQRALAWYTPSEPSQPITLKEKRAQMRPLSRALKRGCYGCHTKGFKGYNDKGLISAQMMAISAEHKVACEACHVGARGLTKLGARSLVMWRYTYEQGLDCADCHPKGAQFKELTSRGEKSKERVEEALKRIAHSLKLPLELVSAPPHTPHPPQAP